MTRLPCFSQASCTKEKHRARLLERAGSSARKQETMVVTEKQVCLHAAQMAYAILVVRSSLLVTRRGRAKAKEKAKVGQAGGAGGEAARAGGGVKLTTHTAQAAMTDGIPDELPRAHVSVMRHVVAFTSLEMIQASGFCARASTLTLPLL